MTTYYVATTGSDAAAGTEGAPFVTLQKAHDVAVAGDTIYLRGGTYTLAAQVTLTRDGSSGNPIRVFNYTGEVPILDGISLTNQNNSNIQMTSANWWHIKGLESKNGPSAGIWATNSNDNIIEFCNIHDNVRLRSSGGGGGIILDGTSANNLILNNDAHHNGNPAISPSAGDGIGVNYTQATGNVVRGNRVWRNNDDGIDLWDAKNVLVENNWAWENGYNDSLQPSGGNGSGFKLGGGGAGDGAHTVRNNLAWKNYWTGFDDNGANVAMTVYNNTAYQNAGGGGNNFGFYMAVANVLKNNLSVTPGGINISGSAVNSFNSWNLAVTVSSADFASVDFSGASGARQSDGSLPALNFLKLVAGSDLIDKGVNVGLAYSGSAPDLGAYEYAALPTEDTQAPTAPTSLTATTISTSRIDLAWVASTDDVGVTGYNVYRNSVQIGATASLTYSSTGLTAATTYTYTVAAYDAAGNISPLSTSVSATTVAAATDTTPPAISGINVVNINKHNATIKWTTSELANSVVSYGKSANVLDMSKTNNTLVIAHSIALNQLNRNTTYYYRVSSRDAAGNQSSSAVLSFATK